MIADNQVTPASYSAPRLRARWTHETDTTDLFGSRAKISSMIARASGLGLDSLFPRLYFTGGFELTIS